MSVDSVGSQQPSVVTWPIVPATVLERQTDRAKDLLMIQRWDQARERQYQTIRALCLLMEVHNRSNRLLASLPTCSAPSTQGDDIGVVGRLMLRAEDCQELIFETFFFRLFYLTFHIPSLYFHSHRTQSRFSRPPDVASTSCSIPRNGLRQPSGRNS